MERNRYLPSGLTSAYFSRSFLFAAEFCKQWVTMLLKVVPITMQHQTANYSIRSSLYGMRCISALNSRRLSQCWHIVVLIKYLLKKISEQTLDFSISLDPSMCHLNNCTSFKDFSLFPPVHLHHHLLVQTCTASCPRAPHIATGGLGLRNWPDLICQSRHHPYC